MIKILLVEDELIFAEELSINLQNNNYIITDKVVSYNSAINSIKKKLPDIVLMDINIKGGLHRILHHAAKIR